MGWVEMSERELRRAEVLASVVAGRMTMTAAAALMGVTRRQAHRLARVFESDGAAGLRHRARGRPSNRLLGPHVRQMAIAYVAERYRDLGPTFAAGRIVGEHDQRASLTTVFEPAMFAPVDLNQFAKMFPPKARLMKLPPLLAGQP
jgi:hypothetical protein